MKHETVFEQVERGAREGMEDERKTREALRPLTGEELRWIARLRRVLRDMPAALSLIADDQMGGATIYLDGALRGHDVARADGRIGSAP